MHHRLFTLLVSLLPLFCIAQKAKVDSLLNVVRTTTDDTGRVNALNGIAYRVWNQKPDTAFQLLNEALTLCEKMNEPDRSTWLGHTHGTLGNYYIMKGDAVLALNEFNMSIAYWDSLIARGTPKHRMVYYQHNRTIEVGNLGQAYELQGNYAKALECQFSALTMWEKEGNKRGIATKCGSIGINYENIGDSAKALQYYQRSVKLFMELKDTIGAARIYGNIGNVYYGRKNYTQALAYDSLALQLQEMVNNQRGVAICLNNIGLIYDELGDVATALECYNRALKIDQMVGNTRGKMIRMANIGALYTKLKRYNEAEQYLKRAMVMADSLQNIVVIQEVHLGLSELYKATGKYSLALFHYERYASIKDSIFNTDRDREISRKEASYEYEKKSDSTRAAQEKKDIADEAERALAEETLKTTRRTLYGFVGGFILVLALVFFIYRGYKQKQRANEEISKQKGVIEAKNQNILDSIHYAQKIQSALLASDTVLAKNLPEYFVLFKPKDIVSGDFYYATERNNAFYLAACDSTGHGVPGAFMSLLNIAYLNEALNEQKLSAPEKIFDHVRTRLVENISSGGQQDGMDGVLLRLSKSGESWNVNYAAAYNAPYVVRSGNGELLAADKMPVGKSDRSDGFTGHTIHVEQGTILYLFTDGYADQFGGAKGKKLKRKALEQKLVELSARSLTDQKSALEQFFTEWTGSHEQVDDVLVIGVKF